MTPTVNRTPVAGRALALAFAVAVGLVGVAPDAHADRKGRMHRYQDDRFSAGSSAGDLAYARVVDVDPIVTRVRVEQPRRECWEQTRYEPPRPRPGVAGPMVLGGLLGGAVGTQIGSGDGRRAATVAGAIIGSAIGHDVGERRRDRYYDPEPRSYTEERCEVRFETRWDERIDGYDVAYEYDGRRYRTRLPYDPGSTIRVRVDVAPAEG
jgi:uncharacterized protein YcfJ